MNNEDHLSAHWDLMLATVEEVATHDNSSVNRLQQEFLEEFGHLPSSELIDYFADLLKTDDDKAKLKRRVQKKEINKKKNPNPEIEYTDKMAANNQITVLAFRESFKITFGNEPPIERVARFLKRIAYLRQPPSQKFDSPDNAAQVNFVKNFISTKSPTVLKFRQGFKEQFGNPPNSKLITYFLKELSKI